MSIYHRVSLWEGIHSSEVPVFTFGVFCSGNHVIFQCKHSEVQWAILKCTCPLRHCLNQIRYFHYHNLSSSNQQYSALGVSVLIQTWPCIYELIFEYHKTFFFFFFTIFESSKVMVILSFYFHYKGSQVASTVAQTCILLEDVCYFYSCGLELSYNANEIKYYALSFCSDFLISRGI